MIKGIYIMRLFLGSFAKISDYEALKNDCRFLKGRWVEPEKLHVTYNFFLDVSDLNEIIKKLNNVKWIHKKIKITGLGHFGTKILYGGIFDEALLLNYKAVCDALGEQVLEYNPHVTFARLKEEVNEEKLDKVIEKYRNKQLGWVEQTICLVHSQLTKKGQPTQF